MTRDGVQVEGRSSSRSKSLVRYVLVAVAAVALTGCKSYAEIGVQLDSTGNGFVEAAVHLDAQAAAQVGDPTQLLKVTDLRAAGWAIRTPEVPNDGGLLLRARKGVTGVRQAEATLRELASKGVFDTVRIRRISKLVRRGYEVRGDVDLSAGVDAFGDERVREVLGSSSKVGIDNTDLVKLLGSPVPDAVHLELITSFDGHISRVNLPLGAKTTVEIRADHWYGDVVIPALLCLVSLGGLGLLWALERRETSRERLATPTTLTGGV
jgi:hypothetical protein